jgi:hypothetical protein
VKRIVLPISHPPLAKPIEALRRQVGSSLIDRMRRAK